MSIHFNVASALVHGDFRDANFSDFNNPAVAGLSNRTKVQVDSELTTHYPDRQGACIDITTRDGRICSVSLDDVIHATQEEVKDRFNIAAANCLGETRATSLRDLLKDMQETDSLDELFSLLTIIPETTDRR